MAPWIVVSLHAAPHPSSPVIHTSSCSEPEGRRCEYTYIIYYTYTYIYIQIDMYICFFFFLCALFARSVPLLLPGDIKSCRQFEKFKGDPVRSHQRVLLFSRYAPFPRARRPTPPPQPRWHIIYIYKRRSSRIHKYTYI